jgi:carotenoid cleavage dioxygenase-like enzyme
VSLWLDLPREHGFEPLRVEGAIPLELAGTLVRCGPAMATCFGHRYRHAFDGDGAVTAVRFAGGAASGAVRLVDSPGLVAERHAGKALFAAYGTLPPGPRRPRPRPKNAANTSVLAWNDRLFALHESSAPVEFDAELRTLGEVEPAIFSAHPHAVADTLYNIAVHYGEPSELEILAWPRGGAVTSLGRVALAGPTMIHDVAVTARHLVAFAPPLRVHARDFATGMAYGDALRWEPHHGSEVIVVPLGDVAAATRFTVEPFFHWHVANAFERGDELVVDFVRYPDFESNRWYATLTTGRPLEIRHGTLARATIDPLRRTCRIEPRADVALEMPRVSPAIEGRPHRAIYAISHPTAAAPHDRLARIDAETGAVVELELGGYPSEPVLVPRAGGDPDDGWLLALVHAPAATHVAVIDTRGFVPVARAWFDHHIPFTFHGIFSAGETAGTAR